MMRPNTAPKLRLNTETFFLSQILSHSLSLTALPKFCRPNVWDPLLRPVTLIWKKADRLKRFLNIMVRNFAHICWHFFVDLILLQLFHLSIKRKVHLTESKNSNSSTDANSFLLILTCQFSSLLLSKPFQFPTLPKNKNKLKKKKKNPWPSHDADFMATGYSNKYMKWILIFQISFNEIRK